MPKSAAQVLKDGIMIPSLSFNNFNLVIIGDSLLVTEAFGAEAKRKLLEPQLVKKTKATRTEKEPRVPEQEYEDSLYPVPGKKGLYGVPAVAFKKSAVEACSFLDGIQRKIASSAFYVMGDILPIGKPTMRDDIVRIGNGFQKKPLVKFRGAFSPPWNVTLHIRYCENWISPEQIMQLFDVAGFAVGICGGRPGKSSELAWGTYHVASPEELKKLKIKVSKRTRRRTG